jgi:sugar-phosphatase
MISAVIYDMDGLIINSEPFWQQAEIEVFKTVGINLTVEMCEQTMGYRVDEVVQKWFALYPWNNKSCKEVETSIVNRVIELIKENGEAMPGFFQSLEMFRKKKLKLALASSSTPPVINAVLNKLNIAHFFDEIKSAEHEEYGKPHPAIFITTAKALNVHASNCLVFEDSFNGLIAAKASKMKAVAIPFEKDVINPKFSFSDLILKSLEDFTEQHFQQLNN